MNKYKRLSLAVFSAIILLLALTACNNNQAQPNCETTEPIKKQANKAVNDLIIKDSDGESVDLKIGQDLVIILKSNPTTGYVWQVDYDFAFIKQGNHDYSSDAEEGVVGAGGYETFNFSGLQAGKTNLIFSYLRPWEEGVEPIEKQIYEINISE